MLLCFKEETTFPQTVSPASGTVLRQTVSSDQTLGGSETSVLQYQYWDGWGAARSYISWECKDNQGLTLQSLQESLSRAADSSDAWAIINSFKQLWVFLLLNEKFKWMVNIWSCGHSHSPSERAGFFCLFWCLVKESRSVFHTEFLLVYQSHRLFEKTFSKDDKQKRSELI